VYKNDPKYIKKLIFNKKLIFLKILIDLDFQTGEKLGHQFFNAAPVTAKSCKEMSCRPLN